MPKFNVYVREVHVQKFEVEAESAGEAVAKISEGDGDIVDNALEYSHCLDKNTWEVELPSGKLIRVDEL